MEEVDVHCYVQPCGWDGLPEESHASPKMDLVLLLLWRQYYTDCSASRAHVQCGRICLLCLSLKHLPSLPKDYVNLVNSFRIYWMCVDICSASSQGPAAPWCDGMAASWLGTALQSVSCICRGSQVEVASEEKPSPLSVSPFQLSPVR